MRGSARRSPNSSTWAGGHAASADSLFLTAGTSQALDFVCHRFTRPGDTVFVEDPTYFLAFQVFRDHGLEIVGIPARRPGDGRRRARARTRTSPAEARVHDPELQQPDRADAEPRATRAAGAPERGARFPRGRRRGLPDAVLREPPPPALGTWVDRGNVLSLGSFSKIVAPGMRLGWIQANAELIQNLLTSGAIISGGCFNHFGSHVVRRCSRTARSHFRSRTCAARAGRASLRWTRRCISTSAASRAGRSPKAAISSGTLPASSIPRRWAEAARRREPAYSRARSARSRRHGALLRLSFGALHGTGNPGGHRAPRQGAGDDC